MATYFYDSGGSNTSPYDTWAKACTSFATVLAAASSGSDIIVINKAGVASGDAEVAADTTFTTANNVTIISATKDDTSTAYTPSSMGTDYWFGNSTTNKSINFVGGSDDRVYVYGVTIRTAGSSASYIRLNHANAGADVTYDNCYFWHGNTSVSSFINIGAYNYQMNYQQFVDCTFRFGSTSQKIIWSGYVSMYNCNVSSAGSDPSSAGAFVPEVEARTLRLSGCDLSHCSFLVGNNVNAAEVIFERCKFKAAATVLATQTSNPTRTSMSALVLDCNSGDTHMQFGYYTALGSITSDTGIYYTDGAAAQSWKIVTTANCSFYMPFETPWIDLYHTGTSEITPYFEIVRSGSATAYQNDEIWAEFTAKVTSGSTKASGIYSDRKSIDSGDAAADQAAGAGTGSWTGENATSWSGKIDSGSAITPAETGYIRGRICVGEPSITVYVDPQIRT